MGPWRDEPGNWRALPLWLVNEVISVTLLFEKR